MRLLLISLAVSGLLSVPFLVRPTPVQETEHCNEAGNGSPEAKCQAKCHCLHCPCITACSTSSDYALCNRKCLDEEIKCYNECGTNKI